MSRISTCVVTVAWLIYGVAFAASPAVDRLNFHRFATEAKNKQFSSKLEMGHAQIALSRARFLHGQASKLLPGSAASAFEYSDAVVRVLQAQFELKRASYRLRQAVTDEKIWNLRAEWTEKNLESPKALAELHAELCKQRLEILRELNADVKPFVGEFNFKYEQTRRLLGAGAVSAEELNGVELAAQEANGLVKAAGEELVEAETQLSAAEKDVALAPPGA